MTRDVRKKENEEIGARSMVVEVVLLYVNGGGMQLENCLVWPTGATKATKAKKAAEGFGVHSKRDGRVLYES